jgi:hypothetical protein
MQVLEILNTDEHRIVEHAAEAQPPEGMKAWDGPFPAQMPFERVWAEGNLHADRVSEIVNGYRPPPHSWPTHAASG